MRQAKILALLFCLTLLIGCGGDATRPVVSFAIFGEPAELAAYQELVAAFAAAHPEIEIDLRHVPGQSEYRQRLATEFSAGQPPDVMLLNYRRMAPFAVEGGLEPLAPYLRESGVIQPADFYPVTLQAFTFDGQLWCIPQNMSSLVVYYNQDLFAAAGLAAPAPDWTWADFLDTARALTRDTDGNGQIDQYGAGIDASLYRLAPFVWQNGGQLVDDAAAPTRLALDEAAARAALQWFVDLQVTEQVVPDAVAEAAEGSESRFLNGRLGMFFDSRRGVPTYRTIEGFRWDVAPLPVGEERAGILHSDGYCMAAATENKEAAWTFIEFANSEVGQRIIARTGRTVPSLSAVAESADFLDPTYPPAHSRVFIDYAADMRLVPVMPGWPAIEEVVDREIERAFYGRTSTAEAVTSAMSLAAPYFSQFPP